MSAWIELDGARLNPPRNENIRGADLVVYFSPYDVPEAVRSDYDQATRRLVVRFKYISDEPPVKESSSSEFVSFLVGANSRRIYGIEIDIAGLKRSGKQIQVSLPDLVVKELARLEDDESKKMRRGNYGLAKRVVREKGQELFAEAGLR